MSHSFAQAWPAQFPIRRQTAATAQRFSTIPDDSWLERRPYRSAVIIRAGSLAAASAAAVGNACLAC
jgi:hypothetical protein